MATSDKDRDLAEEKDRAIVDRLVDELRSKNPAVAATQAAGGASFHNFSGPVKARAFSHTSPRLTPLPAAGPSAGGVWGRVALGVLLGVALTQWSYNRACGFGLLGYLIAVAVVIVAGLWGSVFAWRGRFPLAHVVALATLLWGLALTTREVLPRVGDTPTLAAWRCAVRHQ